MCDPKDSVSLTERLTHFALDLGIAVPFLYFGTQLIAAVFYPGYSFASQSTSDLGSPRSIDGMYPWIFNTGAALTGFALLIVACGFLLTLRRCETPRVLAWLSAIAIGSVGMSNLFGVFLPVWSEVGRSPAHPTFLLVGFFLVPVLLTISLWKRRASLLLSASFAATVAFFVGLIAIPIGLSGIDAVQNMGFADRLLEAVVFLPIGTCAYYLSSLYQSRSGQQSRRLPVAFASFATLAIICHMSLSLRQSHSAALFAIDKKWDNGATDISAGLEPIRAKIGLPALAGAVIGPDGLIAIGATGVRKVGDQTRVTIGDRWRIFSDTKAMTATLIGMYVDAGELDWDAKISTLFPDIANLHRGFSEVTLAQMLAHRSGIGEGDHEYAGAAMLFTANQMTVPQQRKALATVVLQHAPIYAPNSEFRYSNWNYILVGSIVERLSGQSWEDLVRSRIFVPLEMTSGGFGVPASPGMVDHPWDHAGRTPLAPGPANPEVDIPQILGPSSTVYCSLQDWGKFVALFLDGGRRDLISQSAIDRIITPASSNGYAFGWFNQKRKWVEGPALLHNGTNGFVFASALVAPKNRRAYLIVTNTFSVTTDADVVEPIDQTLSKMVKSFSAH